MEQPNYLQVMVTDTVIRVLAGDRYYKRGVDYFNRGLVESVEQSGNTIQATVSGTEDYAVTLTASAKRFEFTCECPLGDDGEFCKHCVAAALAWLAGRAVASDSDSNSNAGKPGRPRRVTAEDIEAALNAQDKQTLVGWLMEWSQRNDALRQKLAVIASLRQGPGAMAGQVRKQLEKAIRIRGFVDYREAGGYAGGVDSALDALETLLQQGHGAEAVDLCEAAMKWLANACGQIDDSDGQMTELMGRVGGLHLLACEQARPDPVKLAVKLFSLDMNDEYSEWRGTAEKYAHLLGETGLAAFREAAAKAWAKVPVRTVRQSYRSGEGHYAITRIMESLARQSGDVEQLVAVLERDLTFSGRYLRIAEAYRAAGNFEKALDWAERGMATYPDREGQELRLFVAEEYRRDQRHADALRILWTDFRERPSLDLYKTLEDFARAADDWDDWRDRALACIRKPAPQKPERADGSMVHAWANRRPDHSLLVQIFLYERNIDDAWREAHTGGCGNGLWLELAAQREKTNPADAFPVYLRLGEQDIAAVGNGRYESGVTLLEKAAALMHALGKSQEFEAWFETLRQRFKAKRNLQKLAEARRRFLYMGSL